MRLLFQNTRASPHPKRQSSAAAHHGHCYKDPNVSNYLFQGRIPARKKETGLPEERLAPRKMPDNLQRELKIVLEDSYRWSWGVGR